MRRKRTKQMVPSVGEGDRSPYDHQCLHLNIRKIITKRRYHERKKRDKEIKNERKGEREIDQWQLLNP